MLCTEVLNGLTSALKVMKFEPGKEFEVITVSIDPREGPELAANKKASYLKRAGQSGGCRGLALPDRRAVADLAAGRCRGLPLPL